MWKLIVLRDLFLDGFAMLHLLVEVPVKKSLRQRRPCGTKPVPVAEPVLHSIITFVVEVGQHSHLLMIFGHVPFRLHYSVDHEERFTSSHWSVAYVQALFAVEANVLPQVAFSILLQGCLKLGIQHLEHVSRFGKVGDVCAWKFDLLRPGYCLVSLAFRCGGNGVVEIHSPVDVVSVCSGPRTSIDVIWVLLFGQSLQYF